MSLPEAVFVLNLLQDVNILRPLVFLARQVGLKPRLLVTRAFTSRDRGGIWGPELEAIAAEAGTPVEHFGTAADASALLTGGGILFAGSESNLDAHAITHDVMRVAPPSYVTVTLQHGFECVGFLQSRDHIRAHGEEVTFAADVVCGWCAPERLAALAPSQRPKLLVTGPTALLQTPPRTDKSGRGLVCENLHSVRFSSAGDFKADFVSVFRDFCAAQAADGRSVTLRPHPGGQYVLRNNVALPENVTINNNPIYKVDLTRYSYGISAPSSILIDMVLAGIPTAVWSDAGGAMDAGSYTGLAHVSTLEDWIAFARDAEADPAPFLERQQAFLERWRFQSDPQVAARAFADLMTGAARRFRAHKQGRRVLFVANGNLPTLQICFNAPLADDIASGAIETALVTEEEIRQAFGGDAEGADAERWALARLEAFAPDLVVFCRYSGPHASALLAWSKARKVPTIFHIDDDLLAVPPELGAGKFRHHNDPKRTGAIELLTAGADLLYCVNPRLRERLAPLRGDRPVYLGRIAGPGSVVAPPPEGPSDRIGYMGMSHAHDLEPLVPVIADLLRERPTLEFHMFGNTPRPKAWDEFGPRIVETPIVADYSAFRSTLARLGWSIGIAPLLKIPFNLGKTNLKWVDYSSAGIAVVASRDTLYDECSADGCGMLADTPDEWRAALSFLLDNPDARVAQVRRAQERLMQDYSALALRRQVLEVFDLAGQVVAR